MDKKDRRKMCICAVIIAVCMLWMGCGQKEPEVLFEMDGDSADGAARSAGSGVAARHVGGDPDGGQS